MPVSEVNTSYNTHFHLKILKKVLLVQKNKEKEQLKKL